MAKKNPLTWILGLGVVLMFVLLGIQWSGVSFSLGDTVTKIVGYLLLIFGVVALYNYVVKKKQVL